MKRNKKLISSILSLVFAITISPSLGVDAFWVPPSYNNFETITASPFGLDSVNTQSAKQPENSITRISTNGFNNNATNVIRIYSKSVNTPPYNVAQDPYFSTVVRASEVMRRFTAYSFKIKQPTSLAGYNEITNRIATTPSTTYYSLVKINSSGEVQYLTGLANNSGNTSGYISEANAVTANTWHEFTLTIDYVNKVANIFHNGTPVYLNLPLKDNIYSLGDGTSGNSAAASDLRFMSVNSSNATATPIEKETFFDDLKIYNKATLSSTSVPANNATNVSVNTTNMVLTFNNNLDKSKVTPENIKFYKIINSVDTEIPLTASNIKYAYDSTAANSNSTVTLSLPTLEYGQTYKTVVSSNVKDIFGQSAANTYSFSSSAVDLSLPQLSITSPTNGTSFYTTDIVPISGTVTPPDGYTISSVVIQDNGTQIGTATVENGAFSYNLESVTSGSHIVTAVATDNNGKIGYSTNIIITAITNVSPTATLVSPKAEAKYVLGDTVYLKSTVSDINNNVAKVEYYDGTSKIAESTTAPYNSSFVITKGSHSISAKAIDTKGAFAETTAVSLTTGMKSSTTIFSEDFNNYTTDSAGTTGIVGTPVGFDACILNSGTLTPDNGTVKLECSATTANPTLGKTISPSLTGDIGFEADISVHNLTHYSDLFVMRHQPNSTAYFVTPLNILNGNLMLNDNPTNSLKTVIQPIAEDTKYNIRVTFNTATHLTDVYVDGVKKISQAIVESASLLSAVPVVRITHSNYSGAVTTGSISVDNFKAYQITNLSETPIFVTGTSIKYQGDTAQAQNIQSGKTLLTNATIQAEANKTATIVSAIYDSNGILYNVQTNSLTFDQTGSLTSADLSQQLPAVATGYKQKLLIWDDFNTLYPISFSDLNSKTILN